MRRYSGLCSFRLDQIILIFWVNSFNLITQKAKKGKNQRGFIHSGLLKSWSWDISWDQWPIPFVYADGEFFRGRGRGAVFPVSIQMIQAKLSIVLLTKIRNIDEKGKLKDNFRPFCLETKWPLPFLLIQMIQNEQNEALSC